MATQPVEQALDFYRFDDWPTDERAVRDHVRQFCNDAIIPIITPYWARGAFPYEGSNEISTPVVGPKVIGIPAFV